MKLLTFIAISIISTIVSSSKCKNPKLKCIELCCEKTQVYNVTYKNCQDIPEDAKTLWQTFLYDNKTISETFEIIEYGKCETSNDPLASIPVCYTPDRPQKSNQFDLIKLTDVPCHRFPMLTNLTSSYQSLDLNNTFERKYNFANNLINRHNILGVVCSSVLLICLPIMAVYTCRKGVKKNLIINIVSVYFLTMMVFLLTAVVPIVLKDYFPMEFLGNSKKYVPAYFCIAACIWLHVIGFQIWSGYKRGNGQDQPCNDKIRLICYSIYVWGISAILTYVNNAASEINGDVTISNWIMLGISGFNLFAFVVLSADICITRCRVANLTYELRFKRKLAILILRLGLLMGFPGTLVMFLSMFVYFDYPIYIYLCIPEPFVIFTVVVWKPKKCFNWNSV